MVSGDPSRESNAVRSSAAILVSAEATRSSRVVKVVGVVVGVVVGSCAGFGLRTLLGPLSVAPDPLDSGGGDLRV